MCLELIFLMPIMLMSKKKKSKSDLNDEYGYTTAILETYKDQTSRRCYEWRVIVHDGDLITFTTAEDILGTAQKCSWNIKLSNDVNTGERILLDGKLIFEIVETDKTQ
jgi:pyruvate kinase